jgi:hypothetical protein
MYNTLTNAQFKYQQRFQRAGLGKVDINEEGFRVYKVQAGDMKESGKVGDLTFTVWGRMIARPGVTLRTCFKGELAEQAFKLEAGDKYIASGNLITCPTGVWLSATQYEFVESSREGAESDHL